MLKKVLTSLLLIALLHLQLLAQTGNDKKAQQETLRVAKLKAAIQQIGLGDSAPMEVKLKTGGKLIGYVSAVQDHSLTFAETRVARTHELSFRTVKSVKSYVPRNPKNWSLILGIAVIAVTTIVSIKACQAAKKRGQTCAPPEDSSWPQ